MGLNGSSSRSRLDLSNPPNTKKKADQRFTASLSNNGVSKKNARIDVPGIRIGGGPHWELKQKRYG
jgi:hypothetical protein